MKFIFFVLILVACGDDAPIDIGPDAGVETPTCDRCNGPGCEDIDQACIDVESAAYAILCDEGADRGPHTFEAYYQNGRIAVCRCLPEEGCFGN